VVKHKSSAYVQELVGLVVGQGFKALIKPEAWAATHAADHVVRTHGKLPRNDIGPASAVQPTAQSEGGLAER
jgi:Ribonuclease H-like